MIYRSCRTRQMNPRCASSINFHMTVITAVTLKLERSWTENIFTYFKQSYLTIRKGLSN